MSAQLLAALQRSVIQAAVSAAVVGGVTYIQTSDLKLAGIAAVVAAGGALGYRGVAEGVYDGNRAKNNNVKAADVGYVKPAAPAPPPPPA